jgi:threonine/homoserine/homoserine lactone efflux protein
MFPSLFLKGWMIGLSVAMPVGPISLLCFRNSLAHGMRYGLMSGIGVAVADAVCGALAGIGVTAISGFLTTHHNLLQLFGAIFLCIFGATIFATKPIEPGDNQYRSSYKGVFFTTFMLTLTNPMTILCFTGLYAGLGVGDDGLMSSFVTTLGVFIGSFVWWIVLCFLASLIKGKVSSNASMWLNKISGMLIFGFGFFVLITRLWTIWII